MTEPDDILVDFALDVPSTSVLVTYEDWMIERDIEATRSEHILGKDLEDVKELKARWRQQWRELVEKSFSEMNSELRPLIWSKRDLEFEKQVDSLKKASNKLPAGLILLELAAFEAYWPFEKKQREFKRIELIDNTHESCLKLASRDLGFSPKRAEELRNATESSQKAISHYWYKLGAGVMAGFGLGALAFGIAAPFIGGLVGASMGLSGAAAVNAGLAALGGGSIAAGGLGMAGGTVVLVGGGALLGFGVGAGGGRLLASITPESALLSSAKLEVVLREFILQGQKDTARVQEILLAQRKTIQALEEEVDRLKLAGETSEDRLRELEKVVKLLRTAQERNVEMASR